MNMDPGTWSVRVADAIRAEMAAQGRSIGDLAAALEIGRVTASRRVTGATAFDLVELERVAAWLGLTPSALVARADDSGT